MENSQEKMIRLADILVQRGFAKSHVADFSRGLGEFQWTRSGKSLRRHLLHLFDVPNTSIGEISHQDMIGIIGLILVTGEGTPDGD